MPRARLSGKGDLFVRFGVRFPSDPLDEEAGKALRQLLPRSAADGPPPALRSGERVYRLERVSRQQASGFDDDGSDGEEWRF